MALGSGTAGVVVAGALPPLLNTSARCRRKTPLSPVLRGPHPDPGGTGRGGVRGGLGAFCVPLHLGVSEKTPLTRNFGVPTELVLQWLNLFFGCGRAWGEGPEAKVSLRVAGVTSGTPPPASLLHPKSTSRVLPCHAGPGAAAQNARLRRRGRGGRDGARNVCPRQCTKKDRSLAQSEGRR